MRHDICIRSAVITLKATGKTTKETAYLTGVSQRSVNEIYARAIQRGFDAAIHPLNLKDIHLQDDPRSGRPRKDTKNEEIKAKVRCNRYSREKTCAQIADKLTSKSYSIGYMTV